MDLSKFGVDTNSKAKEVQDDKLNVDFEKIKEEFSQEEYERYLPWFIKYKIDDADQLIITKETQKIVDFFENFKPGKGLLLAGQAGAGKTTTLTFLGEKHNYEIFELNASDTRNKKAISQIVGEAINQKSLFGTEKLILIDEVDGVSGQYDRGGVTELARLVKQSKYPVVFTANDITNDKIKPLKKACTIVDFENQSEELLYRIGTNILDSENISYKKEDLEHFISERNTSDIRGFINDLQASIFEKKFIPDENLEIRDYKKKIELLLDKVYFSYPEDSYKQTFNTDINIDDILLYLEENTPLVYSNKAFILAMNEISKADVFRGRILKWQYWRYLVYINFYLTYGVSSARGESKPKKITYKRNSRILKKWIYGNKANALRPRTKVEKKKDVELRFIEKLAKRYARSAQRVRKEDIFYFMITYRNNEEFRKSMNKELEIDKAAQKSLLEL